VDGEGRGQAAVENGCRGGQGSPRAVAPSGWMELHNTWSVKKLVLWAGFLKKNFALMVYDKYRGKNTGRSAMC
jgi:hypothetical protein